MDDPIRTLIVGDDPAARSGVRRILPTSANALVVGECASTAQELQGVRSLSPDVVLLDIQRASDGGLAVADRLLSAGAPYVIVLTAYDRLAVDAFKQKALDYVLKPVATERLSEALARARAQRDARHMLVWANRRRMATDDTTSDTAHDTILTELRVRVAMREVVVPVGDLDWIEGDSYYARLHVAGREYLLREPLHRLERRLDPQHFVRVHRSAIVNVNRVRNVQFERSGQRVLALTTGARVLVSRNRWRWFVKQTTDHRPQTTDHRPQTTGHRPQTTERRGPRSPLASSRARE